ncbi:MAG: hypothetical protein ABIJ46_05455 [bacterium]
MKRKIGGIISRLTIVSLLLSTFLLATPATAASFTAMSDTMTRLMVSLTADHTFGLTLPLTYDFDYTGNQDILVFDFPAANFSMGGVWAAADFTFNDGAARTINAVASGAGIATVACADGANNVGVAIDTTAMDFRVLPCGASYVAQPSGATIAFTIDGTTDNGTLTNPGVANTYIINLAMTDEGSASAHTGSIAIAIVDNDQVTVTASIDPTMTFDIDTDTAVGSDTATPYTVSFGTVTTSDSRVSGAGDGVNYIMLDLATNAASGAAVTIANANGANGLVSTSVPADNINNSDGAIADGTERYGFCVLSVAETSGASLTISADYAAMNCAANDETNDVEDLNTAGKSIVEAAGPIAGGRAVIIGNVSISAITPAHNDYTDTITFIATGTF